MTARETTTRAIHRAVLIALASAYFVATVIIAFLSFWGGVLAYDAGNSAEVSEGIAYLLLVILLLFSGVGLRKNFIPDQPAWWKIPVSLLPAIMSLAFVLFRFAEWKAAG